MDMGSELRVIEVEKEVFITPETPSPDTRQVEVDVVIEEITHAG